MRKDFCAFILTHGRPNKQYTLKSLQAAGYTGDYYFVVDDLDESLPEYQDKYGDKVLVFSKEEMHGTYDSAQNWVSLGAIIYARRICWHFAKELGYDYFIQLDDDYTRFQYKFNRLMQYEETPTYNVDRFFESLVKFLEDVPRCASIAMAQNGDFIGGAESGLAQTITLKRKAMNTFVCRTSEPLDFRGQINEDVNTYVRAGQTGTLLFTINAIAISQKQTQSNASGMTDWYLKNGTYVKSFYSVLINPSCVSIAQMGSKNQRLHHRVAWGSAAVKILDEKHKKQSKIPPKKGHSN